MERSFPVSSDETREATDPALIAEYQEVCSSHKAITEFRGKLLGRLPVATGAGIFLLLNKPIKQQTTTFHTLLVAAGIFGAFVTIGLFFYEYRGMKECILLRKRGANLEFELHLKDNCSRFAYNRPGPIGAPEAGAVIYFAVVAAWVFVSIHGLVSPNLKLERYIGAGILFFYLIAVLASVLFYKRAIDKDSKTNRAFAKLRDAPLD